MRQQRFIYVSAVVALVASWFLALLMLAGALANGFFDQSFHLLPLGYAFFAALFARFLLAGRLRRLEQADAGQ